MPFEFFLTGILIIIYIFFSNLYKISNIFKISGLLFIALGYFLTPLTQSNFSLNIWFLIGIVCMLLGGVIEIKNYKKLIFIISLCLINLIIYVFVTLLNSNFMLIFNPYFVVILMGISSLFCVKNTNYILVNITLFIVLCELGNISLTKRHLVYINLFTNNSIFAVCIVLCIALILNRFLWLIKYYYFKNKLQKLEAKQL